MPKHLVVLSIAVAVVGFAALSVPVRADVDGVTTPRVKWAQNSDMLLLTVEANCDQSTKEVTVTENTFSFICETNSGQTAAVSFELREDVDPSVKGTGCRKKSGSEACRLYKKEPHYFDQLMSTEDTNRLKHSVTIDWKAWSDEELVPGPYDEPYSAYTDEFVVPLEGEAAFDAAIASTELLIVDLWQPWCTTCGFMRSLMTGVARRMVVEHEGSARGNPPMFARIDVREHGSVGRRFNVSCLTDQENPREKCYFHLYKGGEGPIVLQDKSTENDLFEDILGYVGPDVRDLETAEDVKRFRASADVVVIGAFSDPHDAGAEVFRSAAATLRRTIPSAMALTAEAREAASLKDVPSIAIHKPDTAGKLSIWPHASVASVNSEFLVEWINANSRALIGEYEWSVRDSLTASGLPIAHVFIDDETDHEVLTDPEKHAAALAPFTPAAEKFLGKIVFLYFKKSITSYMLEDFGIAPNTFPAFGLSASFDYDTEKYGFDPDTELTSDNVIEFCEKYLEGKLKPMRRSESLPSKPPAMGSVNTLVWKSLEQLADAGNDARELLIALYKPWGDGVSSKLKSALERIAASTKDTNLLVGTMDTSKNYLSGDMFPGIVAHDAAVHVYLVKLADGLETPARKLPSQSQAKMLTFLKKHSPTVKEHWDSVKANVKRINTEQKQAKALAKEKLEREKREYEEALANAKEVTLTGDGGIKKKVIFPGTGRQSMDGFTVKAHYTGTLEDGTKFDSSRDRGEPFEFGVGFGQVIRCWDIAFATMNVGERALLTCEPDYAYGDDGAPPTIPAGATLTFDVELLEITKDPTEGLNFEPEL